MISRIGIMEKKNSITIEQFNKHWLDIHAQKAKAQIANMSRYNVNTITNSEQLGVDYERCPFNVDGFSQLYFDDLKMMNEGMRLNKKALAEDTAMFSSEVKILVTLPNIVIPIPEKKLLKRMSLVKRREDVSAETFHREWMEVHSQFVQKMPGVAAYRQNLVLDRYIGDEAVGRDRIPVDGVVELWFEDMSDLQKAFSSESGSKSVEHAKTIIDQVSTFLVEENVII